MTTCIDVDKSAADLAAEMGVSARSINLYRSAAEKTLSRKLGTKRGKTVYFDAEEQQAIKAAKHNALDTLRDAGRAADSVSENFQEDSPKPNPNTGIQAEYAGAIVGMKESMRACGVQVGYQTADELVTGMKQGIALRMGEFIGELEAFTETTRAVSLGAFTLPELPGEGIAGTGMGHW